MRYFIALFFVIAAAGGAKAQMGFDHVAMYVTDLQKAGDFYEQVLQLKKIPNPFNDNRHTWFDLGHGTQLHVISGNTAANTRDINTHLALRVPNLDAFINHLKKTNTAFRNWPGTGEVPTTRPDGVKQVYLQDPDGNWIEVNDAKD
jgi:lactoylglutathione lyase